MFRMLNIWAEFIESSVEYCEALDESSRKDFLKYFSSFDLLEFPEVNVLKIDRFDRFEIDTANKRKQWKSTYTNV